MASFVSHSFKKSIITCTQTFRLHFMWRVTCEGRSGQKTVLGADHRQEKQQSMHADIVWDYMHFCAKHHSSHRYHQREGSCCAQGV